MMELKIDVYPHSIPTYNDEYPIFSVSQVCAHNGYKYNIQVGRNNLNGKASETYFRLKGVDHRSNEEKEIVLFLDNESEQTILINLLRAALEVLENGSLALQIDPKNKSNDSEGD